MTTEGVTRRAWGASRTGADPLVPLLAVGSGGPDPVAITTWHQALGSTLAVDIPHDLFALWLYPSTGGMVLLGPEALARDQIDVPLPDPRLRQDQLFKLEEVLRRARYASAIAVPVGSESRDVGLVLLGSFQHSAFGPAQVGRLHRYAAQLGSSLATLAEHMPSVTPHAVVEPDVTAEDFPARLARAVVEAATGPDLVRRVSGVLYGLLPHDRLEILALDGSHQPVPLSGRAATALDGLVDRFGEEGTTLLECDGELRSVLGARLELAGTMVGYLLVASVGENAYRPEDEVTLATAAMLLAPRVHGIQLAQLMAS